MSTVRTLRVISVVLVLLLVVMAAAITALAADPDGVWVNGVVDELVVTGPAASTAPATPLYVIAPLSATHPLHPFADAQTHGFGAHDHVIKLPATSTTFHGACDLTLVVPGPEARLGANVRTRRTLTPAGTKPLLYSVSVAGRFRPLDRAARIERATRARLASLIDTQTLLACTIKPTNH